MKKHLVYIIPALISCVIMSNVYLKEPVQQDHSNLKIVFIRHGEKPEQGYNLTCKGLNRSLQLPGVIQHKFGVPDFIYVPTLKMADTTKHARMFETVIPLAVKYNLNINTTFGESDSTAISADILKKKGTVLVVWEHKAVRSIIRSLGVKDAPKWADDDYNTILVVTYRNGKAVLATDSENLNPSDNCP